MRATFKVMYYSCPHNVRCVWCWADSAGSSEEEGAAEATPPETEGGGADVDFFIDEGLNVDKAELEKLLAPPPTKRYMRMHADDEEEDREKKR